MRMLRNRRHPRGGCESSGQYAAASACSPTAVQPFCSLCQLPPEAWLRLSLAHASLTVLKIGTDGRVSLLALGDTGGLPSALITRSNH
jgi:hypothetical protein